MTVDPALIGTWNDGGPTLVGIDAEGLILWLSTLSVDFQITNGGATLVTHPPSGPETFTRFGPGTGLAGVWHQIHHEAAGDYLEEWILRPDGSYTSHWSLNGAFDDETAGLFRISPPGHLVMDERRGRLATGPNAAIAISWLWEATDFGTFSVAPDGSRWTFHGPAGDITFSRA